MRSMLTQWKYRLGGILLAVVMTVVFTQFIQATSRPPTIMGTTSDALTTPYVLEVTLVGVERHGSKLLFHFHAHNAGKKDAQLVGTGGDFQFYYIKGGKFTPTPLLASADLATHPAFPAKLMNGASADGWMMFDTATMGVYPHEILYRFGSVPDLACTNPHDKSTCHPDLAFKALVWNF